MQRTVTGSLAVALVVLSQLFSLNTEAGVRTYKGVVTKISDGDTIGFLSDNAPAGAKPWSIRMMTIDTAELHLPAQGQMRSQGYWAEEGKAELASMLRIGDRVELDSYGFDHYGRVLGKVYKGRMDVNYEMVRSGWASLYVICDDKSCDLDPAYREACRSAADKGLGLYNPSNPLPELPFLFRSRWQQRPLSKLVGNIRTKKYYAPEQYERVDLCDRVFFLTEDTARAKGFSPAR